MKQTEGNKRPFTQMVLNLKLLHLGASPGGSRSGSSPKDAPTRAQQTLVMGREGLGLGAALPEAGRSLWRAEEGRSRGIGWFLEFLKWLLFQRRSWTHENESPPLSTSLDCTLERVEKPSLRTCWAQRGKGTAATEQASADLEMQLGC